ncbi:MAG: M81 family metallopeptidase [Ectothiorhodospiraceae bacterium AqS1]|nr:M81 family metallopeptidase [Ectothiorhodospiraceae bacterium AqS1]
MRKIAIAGFQHETNTYAPTPTGWEEFRIADSWPGLLQGAAVIESTRGLNLPIAGAVAAAGKADEPVELIPILWCAAEPGGRVTDEAFERISKMIVDGIAEACALDALYLDLHGAMASRSLDDGEAELLARIRRVTGPDLPIGISLDLHANLSPGFVESADLITIFRSYPHLDMADTGARCMVDLLKKLNGAPRFAAFRQIPFLVPLHAQCTSIEPARSLYRSLDALPASPDEYADLAMGFTAADVPDCGPSLVAYAATKARAEALADDLFERVCACEGDFDTSLSSPADALCTASTIGGSGPVVLADVQDNPGAGASSDTTGLLRALIEGGPEKALLGVMHDAAIAAKAHAVGLGASFSGALGGKSGVTGDRPLGARFRVRALSDGRIPFTGAMYGGGIARIGPSALLSIEDAMGEILVVVSSERTQCLDLGLFTHFCIDPFAFDIVGVKSTVHFRADFEAGSRGILNVAAPGLFSCEPEKQVFQKLRQGVRIGSSGRVRTSELDR